MINRAALLALLVAGPAMGQSTRAERSGFRETSSYSEVLGFLDTLNRSTGDIRVGTLGTSPEGRGVPYVIAGRPLPMVAAQAHREGKPIIWLQANIHGGEVEGKEAVQMLLRDMVRGTLRALLDSIVLLVIPIYNVDGNEALASGEQNRPGQNGPAVVGRNGNGQGLNLNRDYIKLEAPETRGALALLNAWDPDVFLDLHTTNGSYHGYVLTYAPPLNPNESPASGFVRDRLLPAVRDRMRRRHDQETFWYGNFRNQDPDSLVLGWETFDARPRFGTNWMGLRGRLAVLSEGYSNADFETRIKATYNFIREVLSYVAEQRAAIKSAVLASDQRRPDSLAVRSVLAPAASLEVIAEITKPVGDGTGGFARRQRTGVYRSIRMPVYGRFTAARKEAVPEAYLIPPRLSEVVELLRRQGVAVDRLTRSARLPAEGFLIDSVGVEPLFEGHRTIQLQGGWRGLRDTTVTAGWLWVRTRQPLGALATYLLEPASEDGVTTWNLLDRELGAGGSYPILRVRKAVYPATVAVP